MKCTQQIMSLKVKRKNLHVTFRDMRCIKIRTKEKDEAIC